MKDYELYCEQCRFRPSQPLSVSRNESAAKVSSTQHALLCHPILWLSAADVPQMFITIRHTRLWQAALKTTAISPQRNTQHHGWHLLLTQHIIYSNINVFKITSRIGAKPKLRFLDQFLFNEKLLVSKYPWRDIQNKPLLHIYYWSYYPSFINSHKC